MSNKKLIACSILNLVAAGGNIASVVWSAIDTKRAYDRTRLVEARNIELEDLNKNLINECIRLETELELMQLESMSLDLLNEGTEPK